MVYLERIGGEQNMRRFYRATIAPTLFGDWVLIREWGRIGSPCGQRMEEWCGIEAKALDAMTRVVAAKRRRGYAG